MITVVNVYAHQKTNEDVYIGRGSPVGNPFSFKTNTKAEYMCSDRAEAIALYRAWLLQKLRDKDPAVCKEMNRLYLKAKQGNLTLVCYCKPASCHGDVIKDLLEQKLLTPTS